MKSLRIGDKVAAVGIALILIVAVVLGTTGAARSSSHSGTIRITDADGVIHDVALPYTVDTVPGTTTTTELPATTTTITTPSGKTVRIALAGDIGANQDARDGLDAVEADNVDFFVVAGDLSYDEASEVEWCNMVNARLSGTRVLLEGGNHEDDDGPHGHINEFLAHCDTAGVVGTPGVNWHKDVGPVTIIGIAADLRVNNKKWDYEPGSSERNKLEQKIADARAEGDWVLVVLHKLCWNAHTNKQCEIGTELATFLDANADVVVNGHEHIYQRTLPQPAVWVTSGIFGTRDATCAGTSHDDRVGPHVEKFAASMCEGDVGWGHGYMKLTVTDSYILGEWVNWENPGGYSDEFLVTRVEAQP